MRVVTSPTQRPRSAGIPATAIERQAMRTALAAARAVRGSEVPVGCVILGVDHSPLVTAANTRETASDPTGHAEITALREAQRLLGTAHLTGCTLVVTLEPCVMCAAAILSSRISRVVFGAWEPKTGGAGSVYDILRDGRLPYPVPEVAGGVEETACASLLTEFFQKRR